MEEQTTVAEREAAAAQAADEAVSFWERRDYLTDDELKAELAAIIRAETAAVDAQLGRGEVYVVKERNGLIHRTTCHHVRHAIDRSTAWQPYLEDITLLRSKYDYFTPMPVIATRSEVEARRSYRTCPVCSPTLDHPRKGAERYAWRAMKASSLSHRHIGLAFRLAGGSELGELVRVASVITADGHHFTAEFADGAVTDPEAQLEYPTLNGKALGKAAG